MENRHATVVLIGDRGVMIRGASGSGKTSLALALLRRCREAGLFGRLVADDQVLLSREGGRLLARVPPAIAGLVEVRGLGPSAVEHEPEAIIDLLVDLVEPAHAERFPEPAAVSLLGVEISRLALTAGDTAGGCEAVSARLGLAPFRCGSAP
jgi:serine kinase of HPr protein (carbohydrate metabolism regulator)